MIWNEANAYANWLGSQDGNTYRLPTEEEWEYATVALAAEPDRYALVIGNSQYTFANLKNPVNDTTDMSAQLKALGYRIHDNKPLLDLDRASFEQAILDFAVSVPAGSTAIVYYAGHGVSVDGENYLLPVGDQMTTKAQVKTEASV